MKKARTAQVMGLEELRRLNDTALHDYFSRHARHDARVADSASRYRILCGVEHLFSYDTMQLWEAFHKRVRGPVKREPKLAPTNVVLATGSHEVLQKLQEVLTEDFDIFCSVEGTYLYLTQIDGEPPYTKAEVRKFQNFCQTFAKFYIWWEDQKCLRK